MRRLAGIVLASAALVAAQPAAALPPVKHVVVIVLENKSFDETFGPASRAPYLAQTLRSQGAFLPNYFAIGHLSLDNYIAMVSGQAPNVQTQADCQSFTEFNQLGATADGQAVGQGCVYPAAVKTVANQLEGKGLSWRGYMEDMKTPCRHPGLGQRDDTQSAEPGDQYAARHNPFVYFHAIIDTPSCATNDVDLSRLAQDFQDPATTPNFAFVTPNLCNDGHDEPCVDGRPGGLEQINAWLEAQVPAILGSPGFRDDGLVIVTFDEAEAEGGQADASACCGEQPGPNTPNPGGPVPGPGGGRIGAVAVSPFIAPGTVDATPYNHYSLLRSVEDLFGLGHLGYAAQPGLEPFGDGLFTGRPRIELRVRSRPLVAGRRARLRVITDRPAQVTIGGACRGRTASTGSDGRLVLAVRPRRRGVCTVAAAREGYRTARKRLRVR